MEQTALLRRALFVRRTSIEWDLQRLSKVGGFLARILPSPFYRGQENKPLVNTHTHTHTHTHTF